MVRKSMIRLVCAFIALVFSGSLAFGQQKTQLPRQNPYLKPTKSLAPGAEASVKSNAASSTLSNNNSNKSSAMLPLFNYDVTSSRDGNTYDGTIVGRSPFTNAFGYTAVPAQIVPVIIVTNSVFAGVDASGNVVTAPGVTTFNPSVADDSCLTAPNDVPLKLVQQSPIYNSADFNYGGTDLGTTETTDAFQRANFLQAAEFREWFGRRQCFLPRAAQPRKNRLGDHHQYSRRSRRGLSQRRVRRLSHRKRGDY